MLLRKYSVRTLVIMPRSINYSHLKEKAELTILQPALCRQAELRSTNNTIPSIDFVGCVIPSHVLSLHSRAAHYFLAKFSQPVAERSSSFVPHPRLR
jgi:hypothetical protein